MSKEKGFDIVGLFFTVNELNKSFAIPLPGGFEHLGFCHFCLGANYPGHSVTMPKGGWCCGSWVESSLPLLKICERFRADKKLVAQVAQKIRPTDKSTMMSSMDSVKEIPIGIGGVVVKIPVP